MLPERVLDRRLAAPALIGDPSAYLIIAGLAGAAKDVGALTNESANAYLLGGAMGAAAPMGLGLALARPERRVLVVVGDGELMMSLGALAVIGVMRPENLAVLCVDNGHYGETGNQEGHTSRGVDLTRIAEGSGVSNTHTVSTEAEIAAAAQALRSAPGPVFAWLRTTIDPPPEYRRNFDAAERRTTFRRALLGAP